MQINNILSRSQDPMPQGRHAGPLTALSGIMSQAAAAPGAAPGTANPAVAQIFSQYDVTQITSQQFSEMLQKLQGAGALGASDAQQLGQLRPALESKGIAADEPVNLVEFCQQQLNDTRQSAATAATPGQQVAAAQSLMGAQQQLTWVEKFAALHASPDAAGVNALA
jgi:hypothetical protein